MYTRTVIPQLITKMATKQLVGGEHGFTGQRDDPYQGWATDFIMLFRIVCNLKLTNCLLLEVSIRYFQAAVDRGELLYFTSTFSQLRRGLMGLWEVGPQVLLVGKLTILSAQWQTIWSDF